MISRLKQVRRFLAMTFIVFSMTYCSRPPSPPPPYVAPEAAPPTLAQLHQEIRAAAELRNKDIAVINQNVANYDIRFANHSTSIAQHTAEITQLQASHATQAGAMAQHTASIQDSNQRRNDDNTLINQYFERTSQRLDALERRNRRNFYIILGVSVTAISLTALKSYLKAPKNNTN